MSTQKIKFFPRINATKHKSLVKNNIPEWYKDIPKYFGGTSDWSDLNLFNYNGGDGTDQSVKGCGPYFTALTTGYFMNWPTDVKISIDESGIPSVDYNEEEATISTVKNMEHPVPHGFHPVCFTLKMPFGLRTPEGYSALVTFPLNRDDLPFRTPSAIQHADIITSAVNILFFVQRDFEGVIKKGTPFVQIIPFKRDSWEAIDSDEDIQEEDWINEKRRLWLTNRYNKVARPKMDYN
jgi:hypothetical protein